MLLESRRDDLFTPGFKLEVFKEVIAPFTGSTVLFATIESGLAVAIKISATKGGAEREWVGLSKVYRAGVSVPEPLALARDLKGSTVLILEKVEGESLYSHPSGEAKRRLGQLVKQMHEQTQIEGDEWVKSEKPDFTYYDRCLFYWLCGSVEEFGAGSKTQVLLKKFVDATISYCGTISPVFTHQDIHDGQVFVKGNKDPVLIDFEHWKEESQLNELAHYLFHSIRTDRVPEGFAEFMRGYLEASSLSENEKLVLMFNLLFISARALDYFYTRKHPYLEKAKTNHQKILDYIEQERLWKEV